MSPTDGIGMLSLLKLISQLIDRVSPGAGGPDDAGAALASDLDSVESNSAGGGGGGGDPSRGASSVALSAGFLMLLRCPGGAASAAAAEGGRGGAWGIAAAGGSATVALAMAPSLANRSPGDLLGAKATSDCAQ